jgi:type I restriction-modification system DNA methylase subunit
MGVIDYLPDSIDFPFEKYKVPQKTQSSKVDGLVFSREDNSKISVRASIENKKVSEFNTEDKIEKAAEQALYTAAVLNAPVAVATDMTNYRYIDVLSSIKEQKLVYFNETRDFNPAVLYSLLYGAEGEPLDAGPLAEKVWQAIWHATKEEPKQCLMTFVEIFILKFLSDNLSQDTLPGRFSFYELTSTDAQAFQRKYGKTQIEYYVQDIRPYIKAIIPDKTVVTDPSITDLFGLTTIVSPASVINGFAFLQSGTTSLPTFNRTFIEILGYFEDFGVLAKIDPEFKMRLYETFLKKTAHQSKLGQFFTPRNVVRSIISMAELNKLPDGAVLMDPAAGVGGFVLEPLIEESALKDNITFKAGKAHQRVKLIGADVDINTSILAKANTLLHLSEYVRDPHVTMSGLNQLMADMFLVFNQNQHLGSLEYPVRNSVDVIMTNPPYVTQGSKIYKDEIANSQGLKNGVDLKDYYDRTGLGLESLFLRYISGALKPGGFAYVIVPQGLLTRTEKTTKEKLLSECNLRASIALPRNTFFNTPQKTYILVIEKRHTKADLRPDVFCAIASSVGETLDARRVATPADNNLQDISDAFRLYKNDEAVPGSIQDRIKIEDAEQFTSSDRWDVQRFWNEEELVALGAREEAVDSVSFIDSSKEQLDSIIEDLNMVKDELVSLEQGARKEVSLGDEKFFKVRRGKRITRKQGDQNPGDIPVYSGSKDPLRPLCMISETWAAEQGIPVERKPIITINANGYVGACFVRRDECIIHDDVMILEVLDNTLDLDYLCQELRSAIAAGNFEYEAKLYNRVKELKVQIPVEGNKFDISRQRAIADTFKRFDSARANLSDIGKWSADTRIKIFSN